MFSAAAHFLAFFALLALPQSRKSFFVFLGVIHRKRMSAGLEILIFTES